LIVNNWFEKASESNPCKVFLPHAAGVTDGIVLAAPLEEKYQMNDTLDIESKLMVAMFQEARPIAILGRESEPSAREYLTLRAADIERVGRVLKFLGLAEASTESALGWKPTANLLHLIARQLDAHSARGSQKQATAKERKVVESLFQLAGGEPEEEFVGEDLVFCVLNCLGLLRASVGGCKPTCSLQEIFEGIFGA